jgi:hypothetical protein
MARRGMRADARARRALRAVPFAKPSLELIIKRAKDFPTCGGLSSLHAPNRCDTWQMCDTFAQNRRTFDERIVDTVGPRGVWPNSNYNIRATDYLAHWGDSSVHPLFVLVCQLDKLRWRRPPRFIVILLFGLIFRCIHKRPRNDMSAAEIPTIKNVEYCIVRVYVEFSGEMCIRGIQLVEVFYCQCVRV